MSISFQAHCSCCYQPLTHNNGSVCSCSCFMCDECQNIFTDVMKNPDRRCLSCQKTNVRALSIGPNMPGEVQTCLSDATQKVEALHELLKFQIRHYKKCLTGASKVIESLKVQLRSHEVELRRIRGSRQNRSSDEYTTDVNIEAKSAPQSFFQAEDTEEKAPEPLQRTPHRALHALPSMAPSMSVIPYHAVSTKQQLSSVCPPPSPLEDASTLRPRAEVGPRLVAANRPASAASLWQPARTSNDGKETIGVVDIPAPNMRKRPATTQDHRSSSGQTELGSQPCIDRALDGGNTSMRNTRIRQEWRSIGAKDGSNSDASVDSASAYHAESAVRCTTSDGPVAITRRGSALAVTPSSLYSNRAASPPASGRSPASFRPPSPAPAPWNPTPFIGAKAVQSSQSVLLEQNRQAYREQDLAKMKQMASRG